MEEFPVALIAIILSIVSAVIKNNKKKQTTAARKQLAQERSAAQNTKPSVTTHSEEKTAVPAMSAWFDEEKPARPSMGQEGKDPCHDYMLPKEPAAKVIKTLENHQPAKAVIGVEGVDPCHEFMLDEETLQVEETEPSGMTKAQAQEMMRGIIFSEIMARPAQRFAGRNR